MHALISSTRSNVRLSWDRSALGEKKNWSNNNFCPLILVRHFTYSWIEEDGVLEVPVPGLGGTSKNSIMTAGCGSEEYFPPDILLSHLNHPLNTQYSLRAINSYSSHIFPSPPIAFGKKAVQSATRPGRSSSSTTSAQTSIHSVASWSTVSANFSDRLEEEKGTRMLVRSVGLYSCAKSTTCLSKCDFLFDLEVVGVNELVSLEAMLELDRYKELIRKSPSSSSPTIEVRSPRKSGIW